MPAPADLRRGLSTALTVLFGVMIAVLVFALIARGGQYNQLGDQLDGKFVTRDEVDDADAFYGVMLILNLLLMVAVAVVWAVWFRRLRLNAETFAPGQHRFSPGWAAGSWFTPVVNLWFPKQIANDIWRASSPQGPHAAQRGLLNAWWVTWLAGGGVSWVAMMMYLNAKEETENGEYYFATKSAAEDAHSALALHLFGYLITIASAILALLVVRQITRMQAQRAALGPQVGGGPAPYGAPGAAPYGPPGGQPYGTAQPYGGGAPYGGPQYGGQQYGGPGGPPGTGQQAPGPQQNPYGSGPTGY